MLEADSLCKTCLIQVRGELQAGHQSRVCVEGGGEDVEVWHGPVIMGTCQFTKREKLHESEREKGMGNVSCRGQDLRRVRTEQTEQGGC